MKKKRADELLITYCLATSLKQARTLILSGKVLADEVPITTAGQLLNPQASLRVVDKGHTYVSRGGVKLARALKVFNVQVAGKIALDVGAATGGFTDCLLKEGAAKVYAVDVGYGQLAWSLRTDPRVIILERQNIRHLPPALVTDQIELAVIDVSFISLKLVLPAILKFLGSPAEIITLVKPQFELKPERVAPGGIVLKLEDQQKAVEQVILAAKRQGLRHLQTIQSPIKGAKGNQEFLSLFHKP